MWRGLFKRNMKMRISFNMQSYAQKQVDSGWRSQRRWCALQKLISLLSMVYSIFLLSMVYTIGMVIQHFPDHLQF